MTKDFGIEIEEKNLKLRGEQEKTPGKKTTNILFALHLLFPSYIFCIENKGK